MIRADVGRRIGDSWSEYQDFINNQKIGDYSLKELIETAPDNEVKQKLLRIACGTPPYNSLNCGFLAWQVGGEQQPREESDIGERKMNHNMSLRGACREADIDEDKCETLENLIDEVCQSYCKVPPKQAKEEKPKRPLTDWQRCVKEGMEGKEWDPQRIKKLSKLYKEGKCPTDG